MLNPGRHPSLIDFEIIKIYDLIDGKEVDRHNKDYFNTKKGIHLRPPNERFDKYHLGFTFLKTKPKRNSISYAIIEWRQKDRDTLKGEIEKVGSFTGLNKCWFNGELACDGDKGQDRIYSVIK